MKSLIHAFLILFTVNAYAFVEPGSIIYGVVPCLFGKNCFNGTTQKLDDIKAQGVDILWISPVFKSDDESIISYGTTDYFSVRADFGTEPEFKALIDGAHARGMKVIMDIVPNHTSDKHPLFLDEKYHNYYDRDPDGGHQWYFGWENLPNLNYNNPKVRQMIKDAFIHWINFGVDGFRVDAAWGVKTRAPDFWKPFIRDLRMKNKNLIMLAEASVQDPFYLQNGFDLAYDWTNELGIWAWTDVFKDSKRAPEKILRAIKNSNHHGVARFINNNDTGKRFITQYGIGMTKIAAVIQHTVPGTPIVYNGDEYGSEFDPYDDPEPIKWNDKHGLLGFYTKLAVLKETLPALRSGTWAPIKVVGDSEGTVLYERVSGSQKILVTVNFLNTKVLRRFEYSGQLSSRDLITNKDVRIKRISEKVFEIQLNAKEAFILGQN